MSSSFCRSVAQVISCHDLLRPHGRVIVGVSGGADSVALLAVLTELGYDCVAAHCNFHLRGEESVRDMRHVAQITETLQVDLYVKDFDVAAACQQTGESIEMACRRLRYDWFRYLLERDFAQAIAVAHHREDQIETFFLNLFRGSGPTGLGGMRYRNQHVVRPLLDASRREIEDYLAERSLSWVDDSTNASDVFTRNRIRHTIVPAILANFPGADSRILRAMALQRETAEALEEAVAMLMPRFGTGPVGELDLVGLMKENPKAAPAWLYQVLRSEGFERTRTDDMLRTAAAGGSGVFRAGSTDHVREVDHGILRAPHAAQVMAEDTHDVTLNADIFTPINIRVSRYDVSEFKPESNPLVAYIDSRAADAEHHWQLRHPRRGDRMTPYGMTGTKLLSDIFGQARLSSYAKRSQWLLTCDDEIVWIPGLRASALHTVGPRTKTFLRLEYIPDTSH